MKVKQKNRIVVASRFKVLIAALLLLPVSVLALSFVSSSADVSAAPKKMCFYRGPLINDKIGTVAYDCRTIEEQYREVAGENFNGFDPNKCYILSELPSKPATAKQISCEKARQMVSETEDVEVNDPDPDGGTLPSGGGSLSASSVGIPEVDANDVVKGVLNTVYFIAGAAAIIIIIIGGILYATSEGDSSKVQTAKNAILYAVVGLIVVMMAFVITGFVIGRF